MHERLQRALAQQKRQKSLQSAYGGAPPKAACSPKKTGKASSTRSRAMAPDAFRSAADEQAARKLRMRLEQSRQSASMDEAKTSSAGSSTSWDKSAAPLAGQPSGVLQVVERTQPTETPAGEASMSPPGAAMRGGGRTVGSAVNSGDEMVSEVNEELLDALLDDLKH